MTDIVERLRTVMPVASLYNRGLLIEAADEIERLRAARTEEARVYHDTQWRQLQEAQAEIERLRAELKRLQVRALLKPFLDIVKDEGDAT